MINIYFIILKKDLFQNFYFCRALMVSSTSSSSDKAFCCFKCLFLLCMESNKRGTWYFVFFFPLLTPFVFSFIPLFCLLFKSNQNIVIIICLTNSYVFVVVIIVSVGGCVCVCSLHTYFLHQVKLFHEVHMNYVHEQPNKIKTIIHIWPSSTTAATTTTYDVINN